MGEVNIAEATGSCESASTPLAAEPGQAPVQGVPILFIHHSCGGQLLAPRGPEVGESCIYDSHPNGGNLRAILTRAGYVVHEASYDSIVGGHTDMFDYLPKFREQMPRILRTARQDQEMPAGSENRVIVFKSCFTESEFVGEGTAPGNARGPELTVANAKATLRELLAELQKHPNTKFIYVTAPPLSPNLAPEPLWKWLLKTVMGRAITEDRYRERGRYAREFNEWVVSPDGWLHGYAGHNVTIFNYYDTLTGHGCSNFLHYVNDDDIYDSHPAHEGNERAAQEFLRVINQVVLP